MQNIQPSASYSNILATPEPASSAVSWAAVLAGAAIAAALSAALVAAGAGLGFIAMSPWRNEGMSAPALAMGSIIWLLVTQIIAYGVAGYVAGRLRTKWTDAADDEIYFRDTAHGFLVWALSTVVGLMLVGSLVASVVSGTAKAGGALVGSGLGAATAAATGPDGRNGAGGMSSNYFADLLLRPADPAQATEPGDVRAQVSRILATSLANGQVSDADHAYLVKLVAQYAGVDEATADQRLTQVVDQAKKTAHDAEQSAREAADAARKAASAFSLWSFASLLIGAFVASFAATLGGRARDR